MTLPEALALLAELKCSDGYCDFGGPAMGMHTNGGCKCLSGIRHPSARVRLRAVLREARGVARATEAYYSRLRSAEPPQ